MRTKNYKDYKIFRLDVYASITKSKNKDKLHKLRWDYAGIYVEFKKELINKFCSKTWENLQERFSCFTPKEKRETYKKPWSMDGYEVGLDMLEEEQGLRVEFHWDYVYYLVPLKNKEMLKFIEEQKFPFNVKIVSKI